ncbi:MAG: ATP-dependent Clp protease proteolytic subunit [Alphaproteobacteria bacterium]|nr:ATP-dependent Clp protease proteolytic subunit [Alphaproteobacteria bacterium]
MQLHKLKKLAVIFALCSNTSAPAAEHNEKILEACPSLKPGAVETAKMPYGLNLSTNDWGHVAALSGPIDSYTTATIRDSILFVPDTLKEVGDLLVMINSSGGHLEQVETITTAMNMSPHQNITTVCASEASSAALAVLAAGKERLAFPNCHAIVHNTSFNLTAASRQDIKAYLQATERADNHYKSVLTKNGANPQMDDACHEALENNGDIRLSAMDLLHLGLVDGVLSPDNQSKTVLKSSSEARYYECLVSNADYSAEDTTDEEREAIKDQCWDSLAAPNVPMGPDGP